MSMGKYTVLGSTKKSESFGAKANLLQVGLDKQVEMLNAMYKDKVVFKVSYGISGEVQGINIHSYAKDVISITLPETTEWDMDNLVEFSLSQHPLSSIKIPKCVEKIDITKPWARRISRIFLWDTTEVDYAGRGFSGGSGDTEMVIIQSTTGGKPKIVKLR